MLRAWHLPPAQGLHSGTASALPLLLSSARGTAKPEGNAAPSFSGECNPEAISPPGWQAQSGKLQMPGALLVHEHSRLLGGHLVHLRVMAGIFTA